MRMGEMFLFQREYRKDEARGGEQDMGLHAQRPLCILHRTSVNEPDFKHWATFQKSLWGRFFCLLVPDGMGLPRWLSRKVSACHCRRPKSCKFDPWVRKIPLEEEMATRTSILAWRIMDRGAWWSTVHGGPWGSMGLSNWTRLRDYIHTHS